MYTYLIIGASGSIGSNLVNDLLARPADQVKAVRAFDVDEYGLWKLQNEHKNGRLRLMLGDVRNRERLEMAMRGADIVIHLAAYKNLDLTEYSVFDCVDVNVNGAQNVVEAAFKQKPKKALLISSDKAANPSTLYGHTKAIQEKYYLWGAKVNDDCKFSVARLVNVLYTRGAFNDVWQYEQKTRGVVTLTHQDMKRYFITMDKCCEFIFRCLDIMSGGEVFIPKCKEVAMIDVMKNLGYDKFVISEPRFGEKLTEELYSSHERDRVKDDGSMFVIK